MDTITNDQKYGHPHPVMDHLAVDGGLQPAAGCRSGVASHYAVPGHLPLDRKGERGGGGTGNHRK